MANDAEYRDLPFQEAIDFFRGKLNIPTRRWDDLWQGMHARGFMIAGATREDLLADFRRSVDAAIAGGESLEQFRRRFDSIVAKHGWDYNGGRNWRSQVIYATNVRTAYAAGRYAQMTDPDVLRAMPYWMYRHGDSVNPRPLHLEWNGTVLPANHPWFRTHFAPNGWGCKCAIVPVTRRDLTRMGKSGPDEAPDDGTYTWTDRAGNAHIIPNGIDPGWAYNVGEAAWGRSQAERAMEDQGPWRDLSPRGPSAYGRPDRIEADAPQASLARPVPKGNVARLQAALRAAIGEDESTFVDPTGGRVMVTQAITAHIAQRPDTRWDGREAYFPFIRELIEDPFEIWVSFAQSEASGRVGIRRKYVKAVQLGRDRVLGLYAEFMEGQWVSGDLFRGGLTGAGNLRKGRMLYGR